MCIGIRKYLVVGSPDIDEVSTSYVDRSNLTTRMSVRRFTRLTNAFSKKLENHGHMLALYFWFYSFSRIHKTLKATPAMKAGLADRPMSLGELVDLMDAKAPKPKRGRTNPEFRTETLPAGRVASRVTVTEGHTLPQKSVLPKRRDPGANPRCPTGPQGRRRAAP